MLWCQVAVSSPESWSTYGLHWFLIKRRISGGLNFFFHLEKFKRICWAISCLTCILWNHPLELFDFLEWDLGCLLWSVSPQKKSYICASCEHCPYFFVHWTAGTKTSIRIIVYQLCRRVVEGALGTERGTLGVRVYNSGCEQPGCWAGPPGELHRPLTRAVGRGWTKFSFWHLSSFWQSPLSLSNFLKNTCFLIKQDLRKFWPACSLCYPSRCQTTVDQAALPSCACGGKRCGWI